MRALIVYVLIFIPLSAGAEQEAKFWLNKMSIAVESLNYEGTFVFMHDHEMETMHIIHGSDSLGVKERLVSLNGEPREVIRDNGVLTCIWPKSRVLVVERNRVRPGFPAAIPEHIDTLVDHYELLVVGTSRIAGFDCKVIEIRPKDHFRYGYRLCVAESSGMLLKSAMLDIEGKPIEQVMFTGIEFFDDIPEISFKPSAILADSIKQAVSVRDHPTVLQADLGWRIDRMPTGFRVSENVKRPIPASTSPVQHMIVSDGLASVSIFIAKPDAVNGFFSGAIGRGAFHAYAFNVNQHQVTVVGEVPRDTVKMIGESIVYKGGEHD
ncbi:MAG: transcriptional regulator [Gammaproteobacteria bacterium]|nr:transcriptional regulator [Gammaproteobacteria bacterium]